MWKGCEHRSTYCKHSSQRYKNVIQICCCRLSHQRELQIWDLFMCSCWSLAYLWITGNVGMCDLSHVRCLCLRLVIIILILRWWNRFFTFMWLYLSSVVSFFNKLFHLSLYVFCLLLQIIFFLFELNISSTMRCCLNPLHITSSGVCLTNDWVCALKRRGAIALTGGGWQCWSREAYCSICSLCSSRHFSAARCVIWRSLSACAWHLLFSFHFSFSVF